MPKHNSIPIRGLADTFNFGVVISRLSELKELRPEETEQSHRHNFHSFLFVENGSVDLEIDFERYQLKPQHILYIHPNQIHRTIHFNDAQLYFFGIISENIASEQLTLLEQIVPVKPITINSEDFVIMTEALSLCSLLFERKQDKMSPFLMTHSSNVIVTLVISRYMRQAAYVTNHTRFGVISKAFSLLLEKQFITHKRPAYYAGQLNISVVYMNECVKNITGFSVTNQIHQRIILEAKRLLYYSNKSVKEIAEQLGYVDHAYFSRLFTKIAGMTPLTFKNINRD
ncbi:AraC family transcriptional regulator [Chryseobacterium sp. SSA4.19]|uniref:helix-turn-helix domain-containing protein n=1 Tax=Chryseobacterium sp. SSA4.19 TaxID=2919915 RepID=UPI001F4D4C8D|nr:helix-turn-helix transcriptional regulator [Chryseobacterium sp. SSA4.19]MCJ8155681.1 AraC family transcriptional regulator [Chryseobacterium sp. SSA4.19]